MQHPYQCIKTLEKGGQRYLLAASGPCLHVVNLQDGTTTLQWRSTLASQEVAAPTGDGAPAAKKQKLETLAADPPNIVILNVTSTGDHVIAVTAEDKCIHVFETSDDGRLSHLSARIMPKRPSAIAMLSNGKDLLAGDKFGDVYMLPLLGRSGDKPIPPTPAAPVVKQPYAPSATDKTVHSKANLRTLEYQLKSAGDGKNVKTKQPLDFQHKLVLGHVSMLTDLVCTKVEHSTNPSQSRDYVITADRDEHIRVSRGPPQAHVIENFCLAHTEFVSKLAMVREELLISGGGDDNIYLWDWLKGELKSSVNIRPYTGKATIERQSSDDDLHTETKKVAVTDILTLDPNASTIFPSLIVTSEAVPRLIVVHPGAATTNHVTTIDLPGNALSIARTGVDRLIVSVDSIHKPGSNNEVTTDEARRPRLVALKCSVGESGETIWSEDEHSSKLLAELNEQTSVTWQEKTLQSLLYSTEQLRKRPGDPDEAADG